MTIVSRYSLNGTANDSVWSNNWTWIWTASYNNWIQNQWWNFTWSNAVTATANNSSNITVRCFIKWNSNPSSSIYSKVFSYNNVALDFSYDHVDPTFRQSFAMFNWSSFFTAWLNQTLLWWKRYMISCTFNWTTLKSYLNWIFQNQTTFSWSPQTRTQLDIWRYWLSWWSQYFTWWIDELEVNNAISSDAEIKNQYLFYNWFI